jgi:hypothetical protein
MTVRPVYAGHDFIICRISQNMCTALVAHMSYAAYFIFGIIERVACGLPTTPWSQHCGIQATNEAQVPKGIGIKYKSI